MISLATVVGASFLAGFVTGVAFVGLLMYACEAAIRAAGS